MLSLGLTFISHPKAVNAVLVINPQICTVDTSVLAAHRAFPEPITVAEVQDVVIGLGYV